MKVLGKAVAAFAIGVVGFLLAAPAADASRMPATNGQSTGRGGSAVAQH